MHTNPITANMDPKLLTFINARDITQTGQKTVTFKYGPHSTTTRQFKIHHTNEDSYNVTTLHQPRNKPQKTIEHYDNIHKQLLEEYLLLMFEQTIIEPRRKP